MTTGLFMDQNVKKIVCISDLSWRCFLMVKHPEEFSHSVVKQKLRKHRVQNFLMEQSPQV